MKIQSLKDLEAIEERAKKELREFGVYIAEKGWTSVLQDIPALCAALREAWSRLDGIKKTCKHREWKEVYGDDYYCFGACALCGEEVNSG